jgi:hypothetical protein
MLVTGVKRHPELTPPYCLTQLCYRGDIGNSGQKDGNCAGADRSDCISVSVSGLMLAIGEAEAGSAGEQPAEE